MGVLKFSLKKALPSGRALYYLCVVFLLWGVRTAREDIGVLRMRV